jgi:hypothetical protein
MYDYGILCTKLGIFATTFITVLVFIVCAIKLSIWIRIHNRTTHPLGKAYAGGQVMKYVSFIMSIWISSFFIWYLLSRSTL